MISVEQATARILAAFAPLPAETVSIADALGRALAEDVAARVTQPPADVSAMDGYAVRATDIAAVPVTLTQIGQAPAGGAFNGTVGPGQCVRIFTGGPVPHGADTIVIQEDTEAAGTRITVRETATRGRHVRPAGLDFRAGDIGLKAGRTIGVRDIALAAAMNHPWLRVHRKPRIAILATGDEVVMPGEPIGPHQIVSSNGLALAALVSASGGEPVQLGVAPDRTDALQSLTAGARNADLLVTSGGVSVGEHDLVRSALAASGLALDFWQIAMRPGKPLMFGQIGETPVLGLPGNPVSSLVCATIFLRPALAKMLGHPHPETQTHKAVLGRDIAANDRRQDYLRATLASGPDGTAVATPFDRQDSSMIATLARADCLIVRAPNAGPARAGDAVEIVPLRESCPGL
jgi:molybdopterin molybdotransferase